MSADFPRSFHHLPAACRSVAELTMPIVLIVDDSEVDRKLVAGLIRKDIDWIVEFANDGQQALDMMEYVSPNIVVTDLIMPGVDGIQLVKQAKLDFPQIPVILMTGQGSEELAVEALRAGAASYVPKSDLANHLMDTLDQVLQLNEPDVHSEQLWQCFTMSRFQFRLPNDPRLIPPLVTFVQKLLTDIRFGDSSQRRHVGVALEEALLNAMIYGNLQMGKLQMQDARRHMTEGKIPDAIAARRNESPYRDRFVLFGIDVNRKRAEFIVRDSGRGFDTSQMPTKEELAHLSSRSGGRGLTLIGNFMDAVAFNESGNEIRMALRDTRKAGV
jgi:CheY-like chemotaxis protein/anti-sigma regulatory factor (Ser/Thr protein kinase)